MLLGDKQGGEEWSLREEQGGAGVLVTGTGTTHLSCWDKSYHPASVPVLLAGTWESSFLLVRISVLYWVGLSTLPSLSPAFFI